MPKINFISFCHRLISLVKLGGTPKRVRVGHDIVGVKDGNKVSFKVQVQRLTDMQILVKI